MGLPSARLRADACALGSVDRGRQRLIKIIPHEVREVMLARADQPTAHPLARLGRTLTRADLDAHVQLVLSSSFGGEGPSYGVVSSRLWRFVDLGRRLDFLLAGFGWCKMPSYVVQPHLEDGRLVALDITDESIALSKQLPVYAAHVRDRHLGRGGRWLLDDLHDRLTK